MNIFPLLSVEGIEGFKSVGQIAQRVSERLENEGCRVALFPRRLLAGELLHAINEVSFNQLRKHDVGKSTAFTIRLKGPVLHDRQMDCVQERAIAWVAVQVL